jgi:hypothetical protein
VIAAGRGLPRRSPEGKPSATDNVDFEVADVFPAEWLTAAPADAPALVAV